MKDIEMNVFPTFKEDECAIIFSFHFKQEHHKIGEAVIYTTTEGFSTRYEVDKNQSEQVKETVARLDRLSVTEEYKTVSMEKIYQFLELIGVQKCFVDQEPSINYLKSRYSVQK
ncbi:hypothetical protein CVD25_00335 [Bacillus canaveralius]|uniref:Uncharacterized protein n=1 Tax=Bacillus canaveralius TaxID=1403243 RepID=A0A2N5GQC9_9BACI|nr:hypothetical protein [Bacillus canaveralius]PLR85073.1 hypothetical protein CU635_04650 [Bacillus canaveralius]PLS00929.1 hypothetical protein CVD25_00335 [Bacillus canaveralius]